MGFTVVMPGHKLCDWIAKRRERRWVAAGEGGEGFYEKEVG